MVKKILMLSKLITNDNLLAQLALISLAKKLDILNGIRNIDYYNKLKREGWLI